MTSSPPSPPPSCWIVTDGKAGMINQCLGLAEAMGLEADVKTIVNRAPWRYLAPGMWLAPLSAPGPPGDPLAPPWPDILIATGRQAVAPAAAIRRASGGATFAIQIQNPGIALDRFDVVIAPRHDRLDAANVISTDGSMHRVTADRLAAARPDFAPMLADLPRPLVAVMVGGDSGRMKFDAAAVDRLAAMLRDVATTQGAGFAVTASRRTGPEAEHRLRQALEEVPSVFWDGEGANPYYGFLAAADHIVVTADSVNMVTEASATGKPVHVFEFPTIPAKFRMFHDAMRERGISRVFSGNLESWTYDPPVGTAAVAAEIWQRYRARAS